MPPLRGSHLFFYGGSRGSVAPVSAAVQLRRGRSPLHHRAILWRPSGAREFGGRAPARPVFAAWLRRRETRSRELKCVSHAGACPPNLKPR